MKTAPLKNTLIRMMTLAAVTALLLVGSLIAHVAHGADELFQSGVARAQSSLLVSNHVLTTRVVRTADGGFFVQDILVGFQRGTVSFQTLTQVILPRGSHQLSMSLVDPAGNELERISFATVRADRDNWTQSLEGTWRNIRFERSGVHQLVLYWQDRAVAWFHFVVT